MNLPVFPFEGPRSIDPAPQAVQMQAVDPVPHVRLASGDDARLATRYDDVRQVLTDSAFRREACVGADALSNLDPPTHTRLRRLVTKAFTGRAVARLRPQVASIVADLLDDMMVKGAPADLVSSLADPMPAIVVCELLGIHDRDLLYAWLHAPADELDRATEEVSAYLLDLIERKRVWPVDDLLSALVQVRDGQDRLTDAELLMTMLSLFGAGQEITSSQLAKSVLVLGHHPDQWDRLVADPDLVSQAIEELLRYVGLGPAYPRVASTESELSGVAVHAGEAIFPVLDVANRDPVVFPNPDRFDVTRADAGLHLSFGRGIHFCLGAPLARLELRVALTALVTMLPTLRLAEPDDEPDWNDTIGLKSLLVTW